MKKGSLFEKRVVNYLIGEGFDKAERRVMGGVNDRGDVAGVPNVTFEVKNKGVLTLGVSVAEAEKESNRAGTRWWAVVFNRRNHVVDKAFVVISLEQYTKMLRDP